ncbi:MAG: tRNA (adenosine(37)-N6)-threonylcarbamoyltransferase complex dimerization subunit type 1 TsaB [Bdellovibrionaceae bacterium]|nr:tRNA (adenosine(37)-N6)-threonylcarbamoyltransferase complex dimerization subunit type 1 TsaB [Pseudobdellovibrionaceae bacterium]MDW8189836.1 tRNA (adenosine(37)-N6)-threonylcarbamoyltransferase complex dimerization subunit type 1 TsaB [Pseudobdellovibrionaceae bacterium]
MILYISTSSAKASVGVEDPLSKDFLFLESSEPKEHADFIVRAYITLQKKSNPPVRNPSLIVVDTGPGSFTGLRVAVSFVRAWSFVTKIPIVPLSSFNAIEAQVRENEWIVVNAHRQSLFVQFRTGFYDLLSVTDLIKKLEGSSQSIMLKGDGIEFYRLQDTILKMGHRFEPRLPHVIELRKYYHRQREVVKQVTWKELVPNYAVECSKLFSPGT